MPAQTTAHKFDSSGRDAGMSNSTPRGPLTATATSAATFPILMRLPDLRQSKRDHEPAGEVAPAVAASPAPEPVANSSANEIPAAPVLETLAPPASTSADMVAEAPAVPPEPVVATAVPPAEAA